MGARGDEGPHGRAAGGRALRLLLERLVADGPVGPAAELRRVAEAFVATGAVSARDADRVIDDAQLAVQVRTGGQPASVLLTPAAPIGPGPGAHVALAARAVAAGPATLETPAGPLHIETVTFGSDGSTLVVTGATAAPPSLRARPAHHGGVRPSSLRPVRAGPPDLPTIGGEAAERRTGVLAGVLDKLTVRAPDGGEHRARWEAAADDGTRARWRRSGRLDAALPAGADWLEVAVGEGAPVRLPVTPPVPAVTGRAHGRSAGASWLLSALLASAAALVSGDAVVDPLVPVVEALTAIGALARTDPLVRQASLLDALVAGDAQAGDLDPRFASVVTRPEGGTASPLRRLWPIATLVDLGDATARVDALADDDRDGLRLLGSFSPWSPTPWRSPWIVSAFDDRHQHHAAHVVAADGDAVEWRLPPLLDPRARRLRITVAASSAEAAIEVVLR